MSIQKKKKYPLNHVVDAETPVAAQSEHASLSDGQSDELLEIKDAIVRVFGVTTIIESKEDESKDNIGEGQRLAKRPVYAGPEDLVFGNDPVFGGQKAPEDSDTSKFEDEQLVIFH